MKDKRKREIFRPDSEEDFAKEFPTRDENPDNLIFLQGYEGEMYRELVIAATDSTKDQEDPTFSTKGLDEE